MFRIFSLWVIVLGVYRGFVDNVNGKIGLEEVIESGGVCSKLENRLGFDLRRWLLFSFRGLLLCGI